jgi:hypothetical protein
MRAEVGIIRDGKNDRPEFPCSADIALGHDLTVERHLHRANLDDGWWAGPGRRYLAGHSPLHRVEDQRCGVEHREGRRVAQPDGAAADRVDGVGSWAGLSRNEDGDLLSGNVEGGRPVRRE